MRSTKTNGDNFDELRKARVSPMVITPDLPNFRSVLDSADVVVHVLDARDPLSHRSSHLEELVAARPSQRMLFVVNKIGSSRSIHALEYTNSTSDTCPRESLELWLSHLRLQHPTLPFRSASAYLPSPSEHAVNEKGKLKASTEDAFGVESVVACLAKWMEMKSTDGPLAVAVVGLANVCPSHTLQLLY
jgi:nuclear GTP-binding protein